MDLVCFPSSFINFSYLISSVFKWCIGVSWAWIYIVPTITNYHVSHDMCYKNTGLKNQEVNIKNIVFNYSYLQNVISVLTLIS